MTDLKQSPGDRLRFEILLKSLTQGSLNLAVMSDHDLVLDFYGKLFEERLRAQGETHIEFCASTNSEQLINKFNEILSELTLNQALEKEKKHAPRRYLVFRDSILMQDFELQLLARLVNGFPAGNISVILLLNRSAGYRGKLEAFGKNLLQWEVETQAGEVKKPLENWVADTVEPTLDSSAALQAAPKPLWRVPGQDAAKQEPVLLPESQAVSVPPATPMPDAAPMSPAAPTFERPPRTMPWGWISTVVMLTLAAFGYMHRDVLIEEAELMKKYLLRGTPSAGAPSERDSSPSLVTPPLPSVSSPQALASAPSVSEPAAQEAVVAASSAAPASAPVTTPAPAVVASAPQVLSSAAAVEPKAAEKTPEKPKTAAPEAKAQGDASDEEWLKQLPANSYVVQLAAFDTEQEMLTFKRSNKLYAKSRIMTPRKKGGTKQHYFILVSGPFASKSDADAYLQSNPLLAKAWLRTSQSLKTQFERP